MQGSVSPRALATVGVLGGVFLAAIEATIVATAMPTVVGQLGGLDHYSWVFSAYILTSTVTMPLWGRLSDLYGRRRLYLAAVAWFLAGSALSGLSLSMAQLVACRAIQGVGAGGLLPLGITIIGELYTLEERPRAQGFFSLVWGVASIAGPLAGGFITDQLSWRWVFFLNLPFGAVAAGFVGWALPAHRPSRSHTLDVRGAVALAGAITVLLLALEEVGARDRAMSATWVLAAFAVSLGFLLLFVRLERRSPEPILPLDLFRNRFLASATVTGFLTGMAMFGVMSFVPLFVQSALSRSATQAGSALTPLLLGWVVTSLVTSRVLPRVGFRPMVVSGLVCACAGFAGLVQVTRFAPVWWLHASLALMGIGMGMTMLSLVIVQQSAVPLERLGTATSLGQFSRSIGAAFGVAMMGAIMGASLADADGLAGGAALERALRRAFFGGGVVALAALLSSVFVPPGFPRRPVPGPPGARRTV